MARKRNADGTFRGARKPSKLTPRIRHSNWLEQEVLQLKILGLSSFGKIAEHVGKVVRGEAPPLADFPEGLDLPRDYTITPKACWQACRRALARGPKLLAEQMREVDTVRLEEAILANQKGVRSGDTDALEALTKLINTKAKLNGYLEPRKLEVTGKSGAPLLPEVTTEDIDTMFARISAEEKQEFLRIYNKMLGRDVVEEG